VTVNMDMDKAHSATPEPAAKLADNTPIKNLLHNAGKTPYVEKFRDLLKGEDLGAVTAADVAGFTADDLKEGGIKALAHWNRILAKARSLVNNTVTEPHATESTAVGAIESAEAGAIPPMTMHDQASTSAHATKSNVPGATNRAGQVIPMTMHRQMSSATAQVRKTTVAGSAASAGGQASADFFYPPMPPLPQPKIPNAPSERLVSLLGPEMSRFLGPAIMEIARMAVHASKEATDESSKEPSEYDLKLRASASQELSTLTLSKYSRMLNMYRDHLAVDGAGFRSQDASVTMQNLLDLCLERDQAKTHSPASLRSYIQSFKSLFERQNRSLKS
jgi:hypothetical protein